MKPRNSASSFSKWEKIRRKPFGRRNWRLISLRRLYISRSYFHEQDEAEEQRIKFLEVGEDSSEALRSSELALDFVAPLVHLPVVFPRVVPGLERRNYGREAEVEGQLACRVALVGTIHHQRRVGAPATKAVGELALFRRVVLCLPGGSARTSRPSGHLWQPYEAWWSGCRRTCRSTEDRFSSAPVPSGWTLTAVPSSDTASSLKRMIRFRCNCSKTR